MLKPITITQTVAPTFDAVTLEEIREHGRIDGAEEDALLTGALASAVEGVEAYLGRVLASATYTVTYECFPGVRSKLVLPRYPVTSVSSVAYIDTAGDSQTFASWALVKSNPRGYIIPANAVNWPATLGHADAENVTITLVAGYATAADIPDPIKTAIKMLVLELYENRQATAEGRLADNPTYRMLLDLYRLPEVA